jgi:hypothetical protein
LHAIDDADAASAQSVKPRPEGTRGSYNTRVRATSACAQWLWWWPWRCVADVSMSRC